MARAEVTTTTDVKAIEGAGAAGPTSADVLVRDLREGPAIHLKRLTQPDLSDIPGTDPQTDKYDTFIRQGTSLEQTRPGESAGNTMLRLAPKGNNVAFFESGDPFVGGDTVSGDTMTQSPVGGRGQKIAGEELENQLTKNYSHWVSFKIEHGSAPVEQLANEQHPPGGEGKIVTRLLPLHHPWAVDTTVRRLTDDELRTLQAATTAKTWPLVPQQHTADAKAELDRLNGELAEIGNALAGRSAYFETIGLVGSTSEKGAKQVAAIVAQGFSHAYPSFKYTPGEVYADTKNASGRAQALAETKGFPVSTRAATTMLDIIPTEFEVSADLSIEKEPPFAASHEMRKNSPNETTINFGERQVLGVAGDDVEFPLHYLAGNLISTGETGATKSTRIMNALADMAGDVTITVIDPKASEYPELLAASLAEREDLSPEQKEIYALRLFSNKKIEELQAEGADTEAIVPLYINLFRPYPGATLGLHIEGMQDNLENSAGKVQVQGADDAYVADLVKRFVGGALKGTEYIDKYGNVTKIKGIYEEAGHDTDLNKPFNQQGDAPLPNSRDLLMKVPEMIKAEKYAGDVEANVMAIVMSRLREALGDDVVKEGKGYEADTGKILNRHSIISLDGFGDHAKTLLMGHFLLLKEQQAAVNGLPQSEEVRQVVVLEEMQDLLKPGTTLTEKLGQDFRGTRKTGVVLWGVAQNPSQVPVEIIGNANTKLFGRTTVEADLNAIQKGSNLTPSQVNRLTTLKRGQAIFLGRDMRGAMFVEQPTPPDLPAVPLAPVTSLLKSTLDEKFYDRTTFIEATRTLANTEIGKEVTGWVDFSVIIHGVGLGEGEAVPKPAVLARLRALRQDVRDKMINTAVEKAVGGRSELKDDPIASNLAQRLRAIADGKPLPANTDSTKGVLMRERMQRNEPAHIFPYNETSELLFPTTSRWYPINHAVGQSLDEAINTGKGEEWMQKLTALVDKFDFGEDTTGRDFVLVAYQVIVDKLTQTKESQDEQASSTPPGDDGAQRRATTRITNSVTLDELVDFVKNRRGKRT